MKITLAELADRFELKGFGDGERLLTGVASLENAGPNEVSALWDTARSRNLAQTRAGAVIVPTQLDQSPPVGTVFLPAKNPRFVFMKIARLFHPDPVVAAYRAPSAIVAASAHIGADVYIGPNVVIGEHARIEDAVYIGPGCVIESDVSIGRGTRLVANVYVGQGTRMGVFCTVSPGAVIGSEGFGYEKNGELWEKIPQLGKVWIGDRVDIGANTTIDRGALEDTIIDSGAKLDNQVQVAHNVTIGENSIFAGCVGIAGSAKIGPGCAIGGGVGIAGHLEIGPNVQVMGMSLVAGNLKPGEVYASGMPAQPRRKWQKNWVRFRHLNEMAETLKALQKEVEALEKSIKNQRERN